MVIRSPEDSTRAILSHHIVELQMFLGVTQCSLQGEDILLPLVPVTSHLLLPTPALGHGIRAQSIPSIIILLVGGLDLLT